MNCNFFSGQTDLIAKLVDKLAQKPADARIHVILPTLRLATYVQAAVAHRLKKPVAGVSFSTFRDYISNESGYFHEKKPLSAFKKKEIIRKLLSEDSYRILGEAHLHELQQLIREMQNFDLQPSHLLSLRDKLVEQAFKDRADDYQIEKLTECCDLLSRFESYCEEHNFLTAENAYITHAREFLSINSQHSRTLVVGLTTLIPVEWECLKSIAASGEVWLHDYSFIPEAPLAKLSNIFGMKASDREVSFNEACALKVAHAEEQWLVLRDQIKHLTSKGVPGHQIGVLLADEKSASKARRHLLDKQEIDYNCAIGMPLAQTLIGARVLNLLNLIKSQDVVSLYNFQRMLPFDESTQKLAEHMRGLKTNLPLRNLPEELVPQYIMQVLDSTDSFSNIARMIEERIIPEVFQSESERQASQHIRNTLEEILQMPFEVVDPIQAFEQELTSCEVREKGEPLSGVQFLSVDEARSYPFTYVFMLDTLDGVFPKRIPKDVVVPDFLKRELGLPGWKTLEAMEKVTFLSLVERIPHVQLIYYENEKTGLKACKFIELAGITKKTFHAPSKLFSDSSWNRQVQNDQIGKSKDPESALPHSATSLDRFIYCPYAQLLHKNGIERRELPSQTVDLRSEGEWLHAILEGFFYEGPYKNLDMPPWPKDLPPKKFKEFSYDRLLFLTENLDFGFKPDKSLLSQLKKFSWPKISEHFTRIANLLGALAPTSENRETEFANTFLGLEFKGKIDAIESFKDTALITDYKRKSTAKPKDIALGLNAQLPVYLAALRNTKKHAAKNMLAGYWSILKGEWTPGLVNESFAEESQKAGLATRSTPIMETVEKQLERLLDWRLSEIKERGAFSPDPSLCGFCEFSGICRKDDSQYQEHFEALPRLEDFLQK